VNLLGLVTIGAMKNPRSTKRKANIQGTVQPDPRAESTLSTIPCGVAGTIVDADCASAGVVVVRRNRTMRTERQVNRFIVTLPFLVFHTASWCMSLWTDSEIAFERDTLAGKSLNRLATQ
jgi:hypothetical protein